MSANECGITTAGAADGARDEYEPTDMTATAGWRGQLVRILLRVRTKKIAENRLLAFSRRLSTLARERERKRKLYIS